MEHPLKKDPSVWDESRGMLVRELGRLTDQHRQASRSLEGLTAAIASVTKQLDAIDAAVAFAKEAMASRPPPAELPKEPPR
jgi:hypothetical protein